MITEIITADDWVAARDYQGRVLSHGVERQPNYTRLEMADRYAKGWIAETAFARLLGRIGVNFERRDRDDGKSDHGDFVFWYQGSSVVVDVKVIWSQHPVPFIMIPESQFQKRRSDLYVGGSGFPSRVVFYGAAWRSDAELWPVKRSPFPIPTRCFSLSDLWPIESALVTFDGVSNG